MFRKTLQKAGALFLAACVLASSIQMPPLQVKASDTNIATSATATASNSEAGNGIARINDGDMSTRWAHDPAATSWVQLTWDTPQTMKSFQISWERLNATAYSLKISEDGNSWTSIWSTTSAPLDNTDRITLDTAVTSKYLKLDITGIEAMNKWQAVSIYELQIYEGDFPEDPNTPHISEDGTHISMPDAPDGGSVRFCADYEQVIGEDGTIYTPLEDKVVKGFYETTVGDEVTKTQEFTVVVPGKYTDDEQANAKPAVAPELQEWHGTTGQFSVLPTSRIIYSAGLEGVAAEFAADYQDIMKAEIQTVEGSLADVKIGDFYLTLGSADEGLGKEGYLMNVGNVVVVEAKETTGAYWATRSILQILKQTKGSIAKGIARDYPKYEVRGFMLDVGRKPFELDTVKAFAKNMAWYKMNNLHLHLSDNLIFHNDYSSMQEAIDNSYTGFRLESGVANDQGETPTSDDVYYTKADFRDFIKHSRLIGVEIIPEFDMPAHALPITRTFQEFMTKESGGNYSWLIEELDIRKPGAVELAKSIWNDYFTGDDPVFDEQTTVHIGTDEFHGSGGNEYFRSFSDQLIEFVQESGRTVRMWGSLTNKNGTTPVRSEGVQLNIWNTGYANPQSMYNQGYELINTLEGANYIVPAAGYYNDYLNAQSVYSSWQPNVIGNLNASAGDDQILGGSYAMWHDSIDTRANGISEYDSFDRFFKPLPSYAARLWGDAKDKTYAEYSEVTAKTGTAPGADLYYEVETATDTVLHYGFEEELTKDSSANGYDATAQVNVTSADTSEGKVLQLAGGESYLETPLNKLGSNSKITMKVKMDADATGEQILCESIDEFGTYGTYAIKASQKNTGKVGFSREGYDFSFNYTLPAGEWKTLTIEGGRENAKLYVDGELVDSNPSIYFATHETTELSAKLAQHNIRKICTLLIPAGRIGSKTKSFKGQIEYVTIGAEMNTSVDISKIDQSELTAGACSTHATEGSIAAMLDGDTSTYWHTNYAAAAEVGSTKDHNHYITLTLNEAKVINKLSYLPRQDNSNGRITEYKIHITKPDNTVVENYASGTWPSNMTEKFASFAPIEAKSVKLEIIESYEKHGTAAEMNLYEEIIITKAQLDSELDRLAAYDSADYTELSWKEFQAVVDVVRNIAENEESTNKDMLYAYTQALKAADVLIEKPEVSKLASEVLDSATVTEEEYTPESYERYQEAVAEAQTVLNNANATDVEISAAWTKLVQAKAELVGKNDTDKAALSEAVINARKQYTELSGYTEASAAAYTAALQAAEDILRSSSATAEQSEEALNNLQEAINGLVATTGLSTAIADAKELDLSSYTEESAAAFTNALKEAETLLGNSAATQAQIDAALQKLNDAKSALQPKPQPSAPTTTGLATAIADAKKLDLSGYTAESAAAFTNALKEAETLIGNPAATQAQVDAALKKLNDAKSALKLKPAVNPPKNDQQTPEETPKNGDTAVIGKVMYKVINADKKTAVQVKNQNTKAKKVTIPDTVKIKGVEFKVTQISANAFKNCKTLKSVVIGKNIRTIGKKAFFGCKKLGKITFKGTKVPKIKKQAFKKTKAKAKVFAPKKMKKNALNRLKKNLKKAGLSKKAVYKKSKK